MELDAADRQRSSCLTCGLHRRLTSKTAALGEKSRGDFGRFAMTIRRPIGVVAAISPFNVRLLKASKLSASPLATGNTVVLLPTEEASMVTSRFIEIYREAGIPVGAVYIMTGTGADIGGTLTTHPLVKAGMFTGSRHIGKQSAHFADQ